MAGTDPTNDLSTSLGTSDNIDLTTSLNASYTNHYGPIGGSGLSPYGVGGPLNPSNGSMPTTLTDLWQTAAVTCDHEETTIEVDDENDVLTFQIHCLGCNNVFPLVPKMRSAILGTMVLELMLSGDDTERAEAISDLEGFRDSLKADRACLEATEQLLELIEAKLLKDMAR